MASSPFPNEYNLRSVADSASKPCLVCHKGSNKVLITIDNKDFFYICPSHLADRGFATPIVDEKAEAEKKKQEQFAAEKEAIIKEYDERMKKKGKDVKKKGELAQIAEEEKDQKLKELEAKAGSSSSTDTGPRQFMLHRNFYQMRIDRKSSIERAKRDQARLKSAGFFPSAPSGDLS